MRSMRTARKMMERAMPDMDMNMDMSSTTKVLFAGAMVYFGAKMIMEEFMD